MYHIYDNLSIKSIDLATIVLGTSERELIFKATDRFYEWLLPLISQEQQLLILCGSGNNGADGYCLSTHLANRGFNIIVASLDEPTKRSSENRYFLQKVLDRQDIKHIYLKSINQLVKMEEPVTIVIDALVGNGINRPLDGFLYEIVTYVNSEYEKIFAIDVPSGLLSHEHQTDIAMQCQGTFSFQFPKKAFFAAEHEKFVGEWQFGSIGLSHQAIKTTTTNTYLFDQSDVASLIQRRISFAHKGLMGRALQIIGDVNMKGAGIMAALACTKIGAGHTFIFDDGRLQSSDAYAIPELIKAPTLKNGFLDTIKALAIGPGLGKSEQAVTLLDRLLNEYRGALILDADALNIIASEQWLSSIPANSILTPHIGEFNRLFGATDTHHDRIELQRSKAMHHNIYIILKGRYTSIATPEGQLYYNQSGNPAMAKAGSGDVLTGMLLGLRAQGYDAYTSCLIATFVHGHAADLYVQSHDEMTMGPTDLITYIDLALKDTIR